MEKRSGNGRGGRLVGIGVAIMLAAVVIWISLGGFQTGAYGGITNEQQATMDRANALAGPVFALGAVAALVGVVQLVAGAGKSLGRR